MSLETLVQFLNLFLPLFPHLCNGENAPSPTGLIFTRATVRTGAQWIEAIGLLRVTVRTGAQWMEAIAVAIKQYI